MSLPLRLNAPLCSYLPPALPGSPTERQPLAKHRSTPCHRSRSEIPASHLRQLLSSEKMIKPQPHSSSSEISCYLSFLHLHLFICPLH